MTNELIQWGLLIILLIWNIIIREKLQDVKWKMSNLFDTWRNQQDKNQEDDEIDDDVLKNFGNEE